MESEWFHDDIVELIQLYETNELLRLPSCSDYKDKDKKRAKETEIATRLQRTGSCMERNAHCTQLL